MQLVPTKGGLFFVTQVRFFLVLGWGGQASVRCGAGGLWKRRGDGQNSKGHPTFWHHRGRTFRVLFRKGITNLRAEGFDHSTICPPFHVSTGQHGVWPLVRAAA